MSVIPQLASTLFAVCAIQIKPQLEKLLRLEHDSLTKEIRLTQDLLQLFIEYQIPSDMLSFGGPNASTAATRIAGVKRNVRGLQLMMELEKLKAEFDALALAEKAEIERAGAMDQLIIKQSLANASRHVFSKSKQRRSRHGAKREVEVAEAGAVLEGAVLEVTEAPAAEPAAGTV